MMLEATYAVERGEDRPGLSGQLQNGSPARSVIPANVDWREAFAEQLVAKW